MDNSRRQFFKHVARDTVNIAVREIDEQVNTRAERWIRPPFAVDELEFLLACTRCQACVDACQHHVLFALAASTGATTTATPAMDLLNHGCHLCYDWPCVNACKTGALNREPANVIVPDDTSQDEIDSDADRNYRKQPLPKLAQIQIDPHKCLPYLGPECGACEYACPIAHALTWHKAKPVIQGDICPGCGLCREACIVEPKAISVSRRSSTHTPATTRLPPQS